MPDPTPRDLHVDQLLTQISIAFKNPSYIADQMFPMVPVRKQSDKIPKYDQSFWFRDQAVIRAPGTKSTGGSLSSNRFPRTMLLGSLLSGLWFAKNAHVKSLSSVICGMEPARTYAPSAAPLKPSTEPRVASLTQTDPPSPDPPVAPLEIIPVVPLGLRSAVVSPEPSLNGQYPISSADAMLLNINVAAREKASRVVVFRMCVFLSACDNKKKHDTRPSFHSRNCRGEVACRALLSVTADV